MSAPLIASSLVAGDDPRAAATAAAHEVARRLGGPPDLVAVFASPALCRDADLIRATVAAVLSPRHLIGGTGEAIIGRGREIEDRPAVSVWGAILPGARITPIRALGWRDSEGRVDVVGWPDNAAAPGGDPTLPGADDVVIALADPFTFPIDILLHRTNSSGWQPAVVGGIASGGHRPGDHVLWLDDISAHDGLVGLSIGGAGLLTAVSQGCTPIGPEMVVTDADGRGTISALAGVPALTKLQEVLSGLDDRALELASTGVTLGIVIDENQPDYRPGDFLMRGLMGANPESGEIHVGEHVRIGQTVRLHVRDARSADTDLHTVTREALGRAGGAVAGALVFACNGRGLQMFGSPDHDARVIAEVFDDPALAGLFCNGEIGPVGGRNFLHGFTSTIAVFGTDSPETVT